MSEVDFTENSYVGPIRLNETRPSYKLKFRIGAGVIYVKIIRITRHKRVRHA